jgi:hypothetical protein
LGFVDVVWCGGLIGREWEWYGMRGELHDTPMKVGALGDCMMGGLNTRPL